METLLVKRQHVIVVQSEHVTLLSLGSAAGPTLCLGIPAAGAGPTESFGGLCQRVLQSEEVADTGVQLR